MTDLDPAALLAAYDSQLRVVVPEGTPVERDTTTVPYVFRPTAD